MKKFLFASALLLPILCGSAPLPAKPDFNVLMVGFDGTRLARITQLLQEGKMPVLNELVKNGSFVNINIKFTRTDTKAGWSEILTGYDATINKVFSNKNYAPVPEGFTIFERLKARYGKEFATVLLTGKINNLGVRGPHKICTNCISRMEGTQAKSEWWKDETQAPTIKNQPRKMESRQGEPYFNARKKIDFYKNTLYAGKNVVAEAKKVFPKVKGRSFFAFIHFEEPDEQGHLKGESSKEYTEGLMEADRNLGELLKFLEAQGMAKNLKVFVMGDHGFDIIGSGRKNDLEHGTDAARLTFFASNIPGFRKDGDRRDFAPTIYKLYGMDLSSIQPKLQGTPYP